MRGGERRGLTPLRERETWLCLALYALFAASPYSISGIEVATLALLPLAALELWLTPGAPRPPRRFALQIGRAHV